jgi:hypothetical protein
MASNFTLTAQLHLLAPSNLKSVASAIQSQLNGINANINVQIPKGSASGFAALNTQLNTLSANLANINSAKPVAGRKLGGC